VNLPAQLFPTELLWLTNFIFAALLGRAIWFAPWRSLSRNAIQTNALVALSLGAFLFWQLSAGIRPGLNHHLLGATLFVLMFGWHIAFSSLSLILLASMLHSDADLFALGINGLVLIALPVFFSELMLRLSQRHLPRHFILFVLGNGFFCGMMAMLLVVLATTLLLAAFSSYSWESLGQHYLAFSPAIILAEGFTTGMLTTAFVLFSPEAVASFSDEEYLNGK
jgi:uncharacterized membrane protein